MQYLQSQNPTAANIEYLDRRYKRLLDDGVENITKLYLQSIQKVKDDAAAGLYNDVENQEPPATTAKTARGKRSLRNSTAKRAPGTAVRPGPVGKLVKEQATVIKKSVPRQAATITNSTADAIMSNEIPEGKVRIEVFPGPTGKSPHAGLVCVVEPLAPKAAQAGRCMIGRSTGKEYSQYGVSLYKDLETSTAHGTLTRINKCYYFVDKGSSNGTVDDATGVALQKNEQYKLENGTRLIIGQSILQFNF